VSAQEGPYAPSDFHQSATRRWVKTPPNRYRTATEVTPLAGSVELRIALLRGPDSPALDRRNRIWLAWALAADNC